MPLYASQAAVVSASDLYTLDPATAVATSIGDTGHAFTGLAFDPTTGILYGATSNNSAATIRALYTIDPATGAATLVGAFVGPSGGRIMSDLAFDSTGQLWGWSGSTGRIHQIDKATGAFTDDLYATAIGASAGAISFDAANVLYYLVRKGFGVGTALYTVDEHDTTTGGDPTLLGSVTPAMDLYPSAAAFDAAGLLWWLNGGNEGADVRLRTVDVSTLATAIIGTSSSAPGDNFDGLAWSAAEVEPPSEPNPEGEGIVFSFNERVIDPAEWTRVDEPGGI